MTSAPRAELLWERGEPGAELPARFGFRDEAAAVDWASQLLADDYDLAVDRATRLVMSADNLMIWLTAANRLLIVKIARHAEAHESLAARADLVDWLGARGQPVARPLPAIDGMTQLVRHGWSIGAQPVLDGRLLDAADLGQVTAAAHTLAALHLDLACWPDASRLVGSGAVPGPERTWDLPAVSTAGLPEPFRSRLDRRIAELPDLHDRQPVHADYRGANLLWSGTTISGVLDFEEVRLDRAVADLARSVCLLGTWFHDWQPMPLAAQERLIAAYDERRPLTVAEQAWLPVLVAWGMLGMGWHTDAEHWLTH